jgi:secondary thiamine-phosphate synthase enzyme
VGTATSAHLRVTTDGNGDVVDLTASVARVVDEAGSVTRGIATVFVPGATAAITTMEHEPGNVSDLRALLDRLVPPKGDYHHNRLNHDTNAHAHIRAALVGPSESIPVEAGRLLLGTWQQIVLVDFDDRPRERTVLVTVVC